MKSDTFNYRVILLLLLFSLSGYSQNIVSENVETQLKKAARELMTAAGTCALITIDENGQPRARVMDAFLPEEDFTVWFGTNPNSRKVKQIQNNPRVTLYYSDPEASGYVVIHGMATLVNNNEEKEKRWKETWTAFYPNRDEAYLLIKVSPDWMEVVSYAHGIISDSPNWIPPTLNFRVKN